MLAAKLFPVIVDMRIEICKIPISNDLAIFDLTARFKSTFFPDFDTYLKVGDKHWMNYTYTKSRYRHPEQGLSVAGGQEWQRSVEFVAKTSCSEICGPPKP